jgi:hypothetical protein
MAMPQGISNQIIIRVVLGKGTLWQRQGISKVCHRGKSRLILIGKYSRTFLVNSIRVFTFAQSLIYHTSFLIYKHSL